MHQGIGISNHSKLPAWNGKDDHLHADEPRMICLNQTVGGQSKELLHLVEGKDGFGAAPIPNGLHAIKL